MPGKKSSTHHSFVFRFYTLIVFGLILAAAVFDYGFGLFQDSQKNTSSPWVNKSFLLIEDRLSVLPQSSWELELEKLEGTLKLNIKIIPADSVVLGPGQSEHSVLQEVSNNGGKSEFLFHSDLLNSVIHVVDSTSTVVNESISTRLIPPLFYLSILVLGAIWFRPLLRDLDLLTRSTTAFAKDYRQPLSQLKETSALNELAKSFSDMANKVRNTIQDQKDFTNALSHELRTPLARMKFGLAVLDKDQDASFDKELHSIVQDISELESIISHMLDYAKLDYLQTEVNLQQVSLDDWMEVNSKITHSGTTQLRVHNASKLTSAVFDSYLMALAISNLLVNAERYAGSTISFSYRTEGNQQQFVIEDDGEGIPENMRIEVLSAFKRLDNQVNKNKTGFGLGLAIVTRIAELHHGTLTIEESALGGAKFLLSWPYK